MKPNTMTSIARIAGAILLVFASCVSPSTVWGSPGISPVDCRACHVCETPTASAPCLVGCPRPHEASGTINGVTQVPDIFILGELSELYVPVVFPHKLHADMEGMAQGCDLCHHHNPPGRILKCMECHGGPDNPIDMGRPALKGAYHRQCLSCHREWSHETDCGVCHAKRVPGEVYDPNPDITDIMGMVHPNIEEPDTWVYRVEEMEEGPVVTFHHREHVHEFGLKCVECHRQESCGRCHDAASRKPHVRDDPHEDCLKCHDVENDCEHCHQEAESKGFDHAERSGFLLKPYHQELSCTACHQGILQLTGLSRECDSCHSEGWSPETFDHSVTGLRLDENHLEFDCDGCHEEGFDKPTSCALCHDDERRFPASAPGFLAGRREGP